MNNEHRFAGWNPFDDSHIKNKENKMNDISEEQFQAYEDVRASGATNMFDVPLVITLADGLISKKEILTIMDNYSELMKKYPQVREA